MSRRPRIATAKENPTIGGTRPRVLEVLFSFRVGGSETVGLELAHELSMAGAEVMCSSLDGMNGPLRDRCVELGIGLVDLGFPIQGRLARNGFSLALARRLRALRLDAIHLHHFLSLNKLGLPARLAGIPRIVVTEHSELDLRDSRKHRIRFRWSWRLAHGITVIHQGLKDHFSTTLGIPPSRIAVIPNGIHPARWHRNDRDERRLELGIGGEFVFLFVGRIESVKNVPGLIRAFLTVLPRLPRAARLMIVGGGTELPKCRELLADHPRSDAVCLVGEQTDTRRYLAAADAFVMNSRSEGSPRALLEAMCSGLPAICPAVGGIGELLQGRGWLTAPEDPDSLQEALLDVVSSPGKASELGALARAHVALHYDQQSSLRSYEEVLKIAGALPDTTIGRLDS
jgi:glycosyltransferase involved in cell wall biosynthesis